MIELQEEVAEVVEEGELWMARNAVAVERRAPLDFLD